MRNTPLAVAAAVAALAAYSGPLIAQTPADAFAKGCGGCHTSERTVLRRLPKSPEPERRAWIEKFMTQHPCERDDLKPLIVNYLLERSGP
jgi:hypothetical protein